MKKFNLLFSVILCFCFIFNVIADTNTDLNNSIKKQQEMNENIKKEEQKRKNTELEKKKIEEQMEKISKEISEINSSLDKLNEKKEVINSELKEAREKETAQNEVLKTRLRVIYEDGATSYLSILLSSESIFDFFYNLEILRQISQYDNKILNEIKENKALIEKKKEELNTVINEENAKKANKEKAELSLKAESDKKVAYMKELEKNIAEYKKQYERAKKEEAELRAEIARRAAQQQGVPAKFVGGTFAWPAPGFYTITSQFGYRTHPTTKEYKLHTGVDIGVPSGNNVVAAADGVVVISGTHTAYGKYISINHGGGVVTLYAHNSSLLVSSGTSVKKGQIIAKSGNTGWSTGPHLHFEVMVNGQCVNPLNYFK